MGFTETYGWLAVITVAILINTTVLLTSGAAIIPTLVLTVFALSYVIVRVLSLRDRMPVR